MKFFRTAHNDTLATVGSLTFVNAYKASLILPMVFSRVQHLGQWDHQIHYFLIKACQRATIKYIINNLGDLVKMKAFV